MPGKALGGMGPQEFVDATAKDGSLDSPEMLKQLNDKIVGINRGLYEQARLYEEMAAVNGADEDYRGGLHFGAYKGPLEPQENRFLEHATAAREAGVEDIKAKQQEFFRQVYSIEQQVSGLSSSPDGAAGDSKLTMATVRQLGTAYADFVDKQTGTQAGSDRLKQADAVLGQQHVAEALNESVMKSLAGGQGKAGTIAAHADIHATMNAVSAMTGKKAEDLLSDETAKALSQSGYAETAARIEGQPQGSGVSAFFAKFKPPVPEGRAARIYPEGWSHDEVAADTAGRKALSRMRAAGSPEVMVQQPDAGTFVTNGEGSVRVPTPHAADVQKAVSEEPIYKYGKGDVDAHWDYGPKPESGEALAVPAAGPAARALPSAAAAAQVQASEPEFDVGSSGLEV